MEGKRGEMRETALVLRSHRSRSISTQPFVILYRVIECNPAYEVTQSKSFGLFATALSYQAQSKSLIVALEDVSL